uniref:G-protein coupled receptors family 1 profile domain-containing protein n=2 Tax=Amphimedon queenslandica TaxID=400682 RepID=A0A1X7TTS8_AMPQE
METVEAVEANFTFAQEFSSPVVAAVLIIQVILALIANGVVLSITLYQRKSWKQSSTIFFTSLILAHLVLNLLYLPFTIIALAAGEWIFGSTDEEKRGTCTFAAFVFVSSILAIFMTLAAISFDRFLFIVKPHLHKRFMRPWVALTLTIAIWTLSAVLSFTPFFGFGHFLYFSRIGSCFPIWATLEYELYTLALVATNLLIIAVTSVLTFCFTRRFINNQSLITPNVYSCEKKRLFGIFGAMLLSYVVCFIPSVILIFLFLFPFTMPVEYIVTCFVSVLFVTTVNPLIQSYFRPEVKAIINSMFFQKLSKKILV